MKVFCYDEQIEFNTSDFSSSCCSHIKLDKSVEKTSENRQQMVVESFFSSFNGCEFFTLLSSWVWVSSFFSHHHPLFLNLISSAFLGAPCFSWEKWPHFYKVYQLKSPDKVINVFPLFKICQKPKCNGAYNVPLKEKANWNIFPDIKRLFGVIFAKAFMQCPNFQ